MLVKIICGTYGHRPNKNEPRVIRKDKESPAFELKDEEAKRIIALGIAKTCNPWEAYEADVMPHMELSQMTEDEIESLEFNEMRRLAKDNGLDSKGTKEELMQRLKETFVKEDEAIFTDEDEMPPQLEAQEPM